jgi:hypothetical protein
MIRKALRGSHDPTPRTYGCATLPLQGRVKNDCALATVVRNRKSITAAKIRKDAIFARSFKCVARPKLALKLTGIGHVNIRLTKVSMRG